MFVWEVHNQEDQRKKKKKFVHFVYTHHIIITYGRRFPDVSITVRLTLTNNSFFFLFSKQQKKKDFDVFFIVLIIHFGIYNFFLLSFQLK